MDERGAKEVDEDAAGQRAAILLVDDLPANLLALEAVLEPLGHELIRATSGSEALERTRGQDFALILMDVMMPGMDGYEAAALIKQRERSRDVPIVFVTAIAQDPSRVLQGYADGAVDYVTKPFDPAMLRAKVATLVELYLRGERIARQREILAEQRVHLERERSAREMEQAANRMKDRFIAAVSHELRGPLNSIVGWCSLLQSRELNPEQTQQAIASIAHSTQTQLRLIEDLLDVARIAYGKLSLRLEPVRLTAIVDAALDIARPAASSKQVELVVLLESSATSDCTTGDPVRLEQVFTNLLMNAIKFTPSGGRIELAAQRRGDLLVARVEDTGRGIAAADLPHVFEAFWQSEQTSTRGGLGLGLSIVRHIVEGHGGHVEVESAGLGRGTKFTITLPLEPQPMQRAPSGSGQKGRPSRA